MVWQGELAQRSMKCFWCSWANFAKSTIARQCLIICLLVSVSTLRCIGRFALRNEVFAKTSRNARLVLCIMPGSRGNV